MAALVRLTEAHLSPVETVVELDRFLATVSDLPVLGALVTVEVFQNFQGPRLRALPPDVDIAGTLAVGPGPRRGGAGLRSPRHVGLRDRPRLR